MIKPQSRALQQMQTVTATLTSPTPNVDIAKRPANCGAFVFSAVARF